MIRSVFPWCLLPPDSMSTQGDSPFDPLPQVAGHPPCRAATAPLSPARASAAGKRSRGDCRGGRSPDGAREIVCRGPLRRPLAAAAQRTLQGPRPTAKPRPQAGVRHPVAAENRGPAGQSPGGRAQTSLPRGGTAPSGGGRSPCAGSPCAERPRRPVRTARHSSRRFVAAGGRVRATRCGSTCFG